jgi:hypothetical protein
MASGKEISSNSYWIGKVFQIYGLIFQKAL